MKTPKNNLLRCFWAFLDRLKKSSNFGFWVNFQVFWYKIPFFSTNFEFESLDLSPQIKILLATSAVTRLIETAPHMHPNPTLLASNLLLVIILSSLKLNNNLNFYFVLLSLLNLPFAMDILCDFH